MIDIARMTGVSRPVVSAVLSGGGEAKIGVSTKTAAKIRRTANRVQYLELVPRRMADAMPATEDHAAAALIRFPQARGARMPGCRCAGCVRAARRFLFASPRALALLGSHARRYFLARLCVGRTTRPGAIDAGSGPRLGKTSAPCLRRNSLETRGGLRRRRDLQMFVDRQPQPRWFRSFVMKKRLADVRRPSAATALVHRSLAMKKVSTLILVGGLVFGFAGAAQASTILVGDPLIPAGLAPGDSFRFLFVTAGTINAHNPDINVYNNFVKNDAETLTNSLVAGRGWDWRAVVSTLAVDARTNTQTNPSVDGAGYPIYLVNGTLLAADNNVLWTAPALLHKLKADGTGTGGVYIFTGSNGDGTRNEHLGVDDSKRTTHGYNYANNDGRLNPGWMSAGRGMPSHLKPLYAMSEPLYILTEPGPPTDPFLAVWDADPVWSEEIAVLRDAGQSYAGVYSYTDPGQNDPPDVVSIPGVGVPVFGGTTAQLWDGTASAATTVGMQWRARTAAEATMAGGGLLSDVMDLTGMAAPAGAAGGEVDPFVLAMSFTWEELEDVWGAGARSPSLVHFDETQEEWIRAVDGNFGGTANYLGLIEYDTALHGLGDYGYSFDADANLYFAWAVLNHNSQFAVTAIPEPGALLLLAMGLAAVLVGYRRRR